jgi:hypothetical protein
VRTFEQGAANGGSEPKVHNAALNTNVRIGETELPTVCLRV